MKNPIKQLKKVQAVLVEQAYCAYLYGYRDGKLCSPKLSRKEFCRVIKSVALVGKRLQKPVNPEKMQEA